MFICSRLCILGDTCCFPFSLGSISKMLRTKIENVYVKSIKIGGSIVTDYESGFFIHPNTQVYIQITSTKMNANSEKLFYR